MASHPGSKTQRLLDLVSFLAGRRTPVTGDEILSGVPAYADRWRSGDEGERTSARRAFERDKQELRKAGIPIETVSFTVDYGTSRREGYRLAAGDLYLPCLRLLRRDPAARARGKRAPGPPGGRGPALELSEEEARLALEAVRRVAALPGFPLAGEGRSALGKLTFDLDPALAPGAPVRFAARTDGESGGAELAGSLRDLFGALSGRRRVRFSYHGIRRDATTRRAAEPYGLLFRHGRWYLLAHDSGRKGPRMFRVDRMSGVERADSRSRGPEYEIPADFDSGAHLGRQAWELGQGEPVRAEVLFRPPASVRAAREGLGSLAGRREDGSTVRAFEVRRRSPLLRRLLSLGGGAEVLAPPELRRDLVRLAGRVVALYEERRAVAPPEGRRPPRRRKARADADRGSAARRGRAPDAASAGEPDLRRDRTP